MNKFFKITKEFEEIAKLQITQIKSDLSFYEKLSAAELESSIEYIVNPNKILELGCGLGRFSIYLNSILDIKPKFYLADYSITSEDVKYGWNPKDSFYNDLFLTERFCKTHNLLNFEIINLKNNKWFEKMAEINLVYSFLSVGFHYPIEQYFEILNKITADNCIFIFGVREGKYLDFANDYLEIIDRKKININIKEELLVLKKKI